MSIVRFPRRPEAPDGARRAAGLEALAADAAERRRRLRDEARRLADSLARLRTLTRRLERDGRELRRSAGRLRAVLRLLPPAGTAL